MRSFYRNRFALGAIPQVPYVSPRVQPNVLLHFDGSNNGTTFTDESGKVWTARGGAKTITATKKFGSASGYFDGSASWIDTPDHFDFFFSTGDFTIDFWLNSTSATGSAVCGMRNAAGSIDVDSPWIILRNLNTIMFYYWLGSGADAANIVSTTNVFDGAWHHIAVVRYGGTSLKLYVDGISEGSTTLSSGFSFSNSTQTLSIGREGAYAAAYLTGYVDEFRLVKGLAAWSTNFSVPTVAY